MNVFIVGNPDLDFDSLPLRILPRLKKKFPEISFQIKDPNEEWDASKDFIIIDTVRGLKKVKVFSSLKYFISSPKITLHDFDVLDHLKLLEKIGKLPKIKIVAIPATISERKAFNKVSAILAANLF